MVSNYLETLAKIGVPTDTDTVDRAARSLATIERAAAVTDFEVQTNEPFLCRVYPFSWFCQALSGPRLSSNGEHEVVRHAEIGESYPGERQ
jgi:hypothetical protein